jgi:hypothetical protein
VNSAIAIDPNNKNLVYVSGDGNANATLPAFRIDATNPTTFTSITDANTANGSTVHSDSRAITFDANGRLILTSDGTVYARTNPQNDSGVWSRISGNISAFEVYKVAYDAVGKRLAVAAQDNGVTIQSARDAPLWNAVMGADGVNIFVNDVTLKDSKKSVFYGNTQNLGFPARIIRDAQGNFASPNTSGWGLGAKVTCNGIECTDAVAGANNPSFGGTSWVNNRIDPTRTAFGGTHVYVTQDTLTGAQDPAAATVDLRLTDLGPTPDGGYAVKIAYGTRTIATCLWRVRSACRRVPRQAVRSLRCQPTRRPEASNPPASCSIRARSSAISWPTTPGCSAPRTGARSLLISRTICGR